MIETTGTTQPLQDEAITTRHRVLIAAAIAAAVGNVRIVEITPASWTRRLAGKRALPAPWRAPSGETGAEDGDMS